MSTTGRQQAEALLGDLLTRSKIRPQGLPPTDEELAQLSEGGLDAARREEVISHLLNDPVRYQQWLDLCEMAADTTREVSQRRKLSEVLYDWFEHWQFAAATASALAAMAIFAVYVGMAPPQQEMVNTLSDNVGVQPLSEPASPRPAPSFSQEPPERETRAKRQQMEVARKTEPVEEAEEMTADLAMSAGAASNPCVELLHPERQNAPGWLCLVGGERWEWQPEDTGRANIQELDNLDDHTRKDNPRLSGDQRWLAYISYRDQDHELKVVSVDGLFGGDIRIYHFNPEEHGIDYRWDENILLIFSGKRFAPSVATEDAARLTEMPQRFDPARGEFVEP